MGKTASASKDRLKATLQHVPAKAQTLPAAIGIDPRDAASLEEQKRRTTHVLPGRAGHSRLEPVPGLSEPGRVSV